MLCIPPYNIENTTPGEVYAKALSCLDKEQRRAMIIVDPPEKWIDKSKPSDTKIGIDASGSEGLNIARHKMPLSTSLVLSLLIH